MRLGCGKGVPDPRSQPVLLQYSLNGGLTWSLLQEFLFSNSSNIGRYIAMEIPLKARSSSTRLRWWQPSENGHFYSPWVIDQVIHLLYFKIWPHIVLRLSISTVLIFVPLLVLPRKPLEWYFRNTKMQQNHLSKLMCRSVCAFNMLLSCWVQISISILESFLTLG